MVERPEKVQRSIAIVFVRFDEISHDRELHARDVFPNPKGPENRMQVLHEFIDFH